MNLKPNATTDASSSKLVETLQTSNIKAQPSHTIPGNVFSEIEQDSHPSAYIPKQSGRHYDTGDDGYKKDENQHLKYEDLDRDAAADLDVDDRGSTSDSTDSQITPNVSEVKKLFLYNQNISTPVITKEPEASSNCCPYEKLQKDRVVTQVSSTDSQHWLGYGSFNAAFNESECFQDLHQLPAHESRHTSSSVCFGMQWSPDSYKETCDIFCQRKSLKNATEFMDTDEWDVVEDRSNPDNTSGASGAIYRMPGRETMGNDIITRMQYIVPGATNQTKTGVIEGSLLQGSSSTSRNNNSRYSEENFPVTDTSHLEQFVQSVTGMRELQSEPTAVTCGFLDNLIQPSLTDTYHLGMGNWNQANEPVRAMRNLFVDVNMYDGEVASQSEVSAKPTCSDAAGMVWVQTSSRTRTACTYLSSIIQKESHENTRKTRNDLQTEGSANYCSFTQYESRDTTELAVESNQSPRCQSPHKLQSPALDSDEKLATDLDGYLNSSTSSRQPMTELVDSRVYVDSSLSSFTPWPTGSEQEPVNLLRRCPHFENISSLWECYSGDVESAVPKSLKVPDAPFDAQEEEFDYSEGVNDKLTRTWFRETSQRDQQPQALIDLQQEDVMWSNLFSPSDSLVESAKEVSLQLNLMSVTGDDEAEAVDAFMHRTSSLDHLKKLSSGLVWPGANISEVQETFLQQNPDFSTTLPKEQYHTDDPESRAVLAEEQSALPEVRGQDDRECNKHGLHIQQTCATINSIIPFANTSEAMINMISQSSMHQENTSIDCQTSKVGNELGTNKSDSADTVVRSLTIARNKVSYGEIDRPDEAQIDHVTSRPVRDIPLDSYGEDTRLGSKCVGDNNASSLQIAFGTLGSAVGVTGCLSPLFDVDQSIGSPSVSINTGEQTGAEVDTRSTQFNEYATACTGHNWYAAPLRISDLRNLIYPSEQKFRNEPEIPCFTSKAETAVELTGGPINHGGITTDVSYNTSPKELSILSTDNLPLFYLEQPPVQSRRHEEFESFVPSVCYTWLGTKTSADPGLSIVNPKDRSATAASSISDRGREIAKRALISKRPTSPDTHYSFLCHWDNPLTANFSADPSDFLRESGLFTAHKCSLKAITCTGWRSCYPRVTDDCLFSPEDSISDFVITEQPRNFYNRLLHNSLLATRTFKNNFSQLLIVETEPVTLSKAKHRLNLLQRIQEEAVLTLEEHTPASTDLQTELMHSHADCVLRRRRPRSSSYTYSTHPSTDGLFCTRRQDGRRRHSSHAWETGDKFSAVGRFKAVDDSYADRHLVKDDFDLHRFQRSPSMHRLSSRIYARDDEWHPVHDPVFGTGYGSSCGGRYSANGFFRSSHIEPRDVRYFAPNSSTCDCPRAIHTGSYLYPSKFTVQPKTVVNRQVKRESVRLRHNILDGDIPHYTGKWQTESDAYSAVASFSSLLRRNYEEDLRKAKTCTAQDPFSHSGRSLGYLKEILQRDGAECHIYSPRISPVAYSLKRPASLRSAPAPSGYRGGMLSKSIEYLGPKNYFKLGAFDTSMHTLRARLAAARSESYLNSAMEETAEPLIDTSEIKYRSLDRHYGREDRTTVQLRRQVERQHRQLLENLFKETSSDFGLAPCMYTDPVTTVSAICDQLYHPTTLGAVLDDKTMNYPPQAPLISSTMAPPIFTTAALQNMADGYSAWTSSAASFTPVNRPPSDVLLSTQTPPSLEYTSTQLQPQTLVPQSEELTGPVDSNANLLELLQDPKFLQSVALNPELTAQLASLCSDFTLTDANQVTLAAMTGAITATAIANAGLIDGSVCNLDGLWNLANDPGVSEFKEQEPYPQNDWIHSATKTSEQPAYALSSLDSERLEQVLQQLRMVLNKDLDSQNEANAEMADRDESDARHLAQTMRYNGLAHAVDSNISAHPSSFPANTQSECIRPSEAVNSWLVTNSNFTDRAQSNERTDLLLPAMDWPTFVTAQPTPRPTCGKHERAKHVYDFPTKRILIMRDSRDRYQKKNGIGMRIVGGHVRSDGRLGAFVEEIDPRGSVDQLHGEIQEGDEILEWNSVSLVGRTFEEVQAIISQVTEETELLVRAREDEQHGSAGQPWDRSVVKQSRQQPMGKFHLLCT
ncbi:unnamed protein product [Dicrocoelium dendriticum]|nr:unnamed protein product [Dicrocoelium dendriticum]